MLHILKMTILTSILSAQHPNAGRNIQQTEIENLIITLAKGKLIF